MTKPTGYVRVSFTDGKTKIHVPWPVIPEDYEGKARAVHLRMQVTATMWLRGFYIYNGESDE